MQSSTLPGQGESFTCDLGIPGESLKTETTHFLPDFVKWKPSFGNFKFIGEGKHSNNLFILSAYVTYRTSYGAL